LLTAEGLEVVKQQAKDVGVQLATVGFGMSEAVSGQRALREMAWPTADSFYDAATDPQRLQKILSVARAKLTSRIQLSFYANRPTKDLLAGQTLQFHIMLQPIAGGGTISSRHEPSWAAPMGAVPLFEAPCSSDEERAASAVVFLGNGAGGPAPSRRDIVLKRLGILAAIGGILVIFWLGVPRILWHQSYARPKTPDARAVTADVITPPSPPLAPTPASDRPGPGQTWPLGTDGLRPDATLWMPRPSSGTEGSSSPAQATQPLDPGTPQTPSDANLYHPPGKRPSKDD
jgi:hypothetical protein